MKKPDPHYKKMVLNSQHCFAGLSFHFPHMLRLRSVLRIRIRIRMDPHDFGLLDPHPESAFQMRIPDADADSD
jgi:hypothetical protein